MSFDFRAYQKKRVRSYFIPVFIFLLLSLGSISHPLKNESSATGLNGGIEKKNNSEIKSIPPVSLKFHSLSQEKGLTMHMVVRMFRDSKGFMWLFNEEDICRFDGRTIKTYYPQYPVDMNLPFEGLTYYGSSIIEDSLSNIWFNTPYCMVCYERQKDAFLFYPCVDNKGKLIDGFYRIFKYEPPMIYLLHENQNQKFNVIERKFYPDDSNVFRLPFQSNDIEIFCRDRNGNRDTVFNVRQIPGIEISESYNSVVMASDTELYASTNKGLLLVNPATRQFEFFNSNMNSASEKNFALGDILYSDGYIWATTALHGLMVFDTHLKQFVAQYLDGVTDQVNPAVNDIIHIYMDYEKNIWVSSFTQDLCYANLNSQKFLYLLTKNECKEKGYDNFIRSMTQDRFGNVWCGTAYGGAVVFDSTKKIIAHYPFPPGKEQVHMEYMMTDSKGRIWVASWAGFYMFDEAINNFRQINTCKESVPASQFNYVLELNDGTLLVTPRQTHFFIFNEQSHCLESLVESTPDSVGTFLYQDKKGRFYFYDEKDLIVYSSLQKRELSKRILPVKHPVKSLYETDSVLWISTISGLVKMNMETFACTYITTKDGLPDDYIYAALPDKKGNLWLSSNHGIIRYNPTLGTCKNYTIEDGLQSNEFDSHAFLLRKNGEIWFGGVNGVNVFHPDSLEDNVNAAKPTIVSMWVNDEAYNPDSVNISETKYFSFPYSKSTLSFEFASLEFTDASRNEFMYKMEGFDKEWVQSGTRNFARYANLPVGDYTFLLKAANNNGVWDKSVRELSISILPAWWQTWWFRLLVFVSAVSAVYVFYNYRLRMAIEKQQAIEQERKRISADLHDDIGATLSSISIFSEAASQKLRKANTDDAKNLLDRISSDSQEMVSVMSDFVWSLNPANDSFQKLIDRMLSYASPVLSAKNIMMNFESDPELNKTFIHPDKRKNVFLIFKEAVNNAAKYSNAGEVSVNIKSENGNISMQISDNGTGFNTGVPVNGNGLNNMRERAEEMDGSLHISSDGNGTRLKLQFEV